MLLLEAVDEINFSTKKVFNYKNLLNFVTHQKFFFLIAKIFGVWLLVTVNPLSTASFKQSIVLYCCVPSKRFLKESSHKKVIWKKKYRIRKSQISTRIWTLAYETNIQWVNQILYLRIYTKNNCLKLNNLFCLKFSNWTVQNCIIPFMTTVK